MQDCKIRWNYLCHPTMRLFLQQETYDSRQQYLAQVGEQERDIIAFSILVHSMSKGGFLHFFSDDHGVSAAAVHNVLCKINAVSVKNLLEQSEKILEPVLQTWPNSTFIELLGHLLESEKEKIYRLDQAYWQEEEKIYYRAYQYYSNLG